jgi:hypothetical protein
MLIKSNTEQGACHCSSTNQVLQTRMSWIAFNWHKSRIVLSLPIRGNETSEIISGNQLLDVPPSILWRYSPSRALASSHIGGFLTFLVL